MSLGIVLAPYGKIPGGFPSGITYSGAGKQRFLPPDDPQWNTTGEPGMYYDTALGALRGNAVTRFFARMRARRGFGSIPTDFELAPYRGYLPVNSGWIATGEGYRSGGWQPPAGAPQGGYPIPVQPLSGLRGLRDVAPAQPATTVDDVMAAMIAHNDRVFALTLVSTTAVAVSALLTVFRTLKLIREER